jgi:hypothetical protein
MPLKKIDLPPRQKTFEIVNFVPLCLGGKKSFFMEFNNKNGENI